jgi:hypothetical protein
MKLHGPGNIKKIRPINSWAYERSNRAAAAAARS